jgi:LmbE family N-acetylglucosaminyl deacetylase
MAKISRRKVLSLSGIPLALSAFGISALSANVGQPSEPAKKLKIVVVGAHPDDPETGCGGTMILFSDAGHEVVSAYLTRGEAGIDGKSHADAAQIRTLEAKQACTIMNARAAFLGQVDGSCEITPKRYDDLFQFLAGEKPDLVFTHWPVDSHRDHRICSVLVYDAWLRMNKSFGLFYFEVESGGQTQNFAPTDFVDISLVADRKHKACNCHVSQGMEIVYSEYHAQMEKFRGMQAGSRFAEAFVRHDQSSVGIRQFI